MARTRRNPVAMSAGRGQLILAFLGLPVAADATILLGWVFCRHCAHAWAPCQTAPVDVPHEFVSDKIQ